MFRWHLWYFSSHHPTQLLLLETTPMPCRPIIFYRRAMPASAQHPAEIGDFDRCGASLRAFPQGLWSPQHGNAVQVRLVVLGKCCCCCCCGGGGDVPLCTQRVATLRLCLLWRPYSVIHRHWAPMSTYNHTHTHTHTHSALYTHASFNHGSRILSYLLRLGMYQVLYTTEHATQGKTTRGEASLPLDVVRGA